MDTGAIAKVRLSQANVRKRKNSLQTNPVLQEQKPIKGILKTAKQNKKPMMKEKQTSARNSLSKHQFQTDNQKSPQAVSSDLSKHEEEVVFGLADSYLSTANSDSLEFGQQEVIVLKTEKGLPTQTYQLECTMLNSIADNSKISRIEKELNTVKTPELVTRYIMRNTTPILVHSSWSTPRKIRKSTFTNYRHTARTWGTPETHCYLTCKRSSPKRNIYTREFGNKNVIRKKKIKIIPAALVNPAMKTILHTEVLKAKKVDNVRAKNIIPVKPECLEKTDYNSPNVKNLVSRFENMAKQSTNFNYKNNTFTNYSFRKHSFSQTTISMDTSNSEDKPLQTKLLENEESLKHKTTIATDGSTENQFNNRICNNFISNNKDGTVSNLITDIDDNHNDDDKFNSNHSAIDYDLTIETRDEPCQSILLKPMTAIENFGFTEPGTLPADNSYSNYDHHELSNKCSSDINKEVPETFPTDNPSSKHNRYQPTNKRSYDVTDNEKEDAETVGEEYLSLFKVPEIKKRRTKSEFSNETNEVSSFEQQSEPYGTNKIISHKDKNTSEIKYFIKVYENDVFEDNFDDYKIYTENNLANIKTEIIETKTTREFELREEDFPPFISPEKITEYID